MGNDSEEWGGICGAREAGRQATGENAIKKDHSLTMEEDALSSFYFS